ncbi:MAG: helix-turn-helix domain-containing protein [Pseudomonadota bacterium]
MRYPGQERIEALLAENAKLRRENEILSYRMENLLGRIGTGQRLGLTSAEYRLTHLMANASPYVVTKEALLEARRQDSLSMNDGVKIKIVDVIICKIRKKLKPYGIEIKTIWGCGYQMEKDSADRFYELTYAEDVGEAA